MKKIIITVIGPDKPGIIASVSESLFKNECNIENISQTILQSEFACLCVATIPDLLSLEILHKTMNQDLEGKSLHVHIKALGDDEATGQKESTEPFIISTCGPDKKGLVAKVSRVIADTGANISNLKAMFKGGSNPDRNIMIFEVDVPVRLDLPVLSDKLKNLASELNLDLTMQHKNIFDAVNRI